MVRRYSSKLSNVALMLLLTCPSPTTQPTGEHYNGAASLDLTPVSLLLMECCVFLFLYVSECGDNTSFGWIVQPPGSGDGEEERPLAPLGRTQGKRMAMAPR
jgi:hypothetical protein